MTIDPTSDSTVRLVNELSKKQRLAIASIGTIDALEFPSVATLAEVGIDRYPELEAKPPHDTVDAARALPPFEPCDQLVATAGGAWTVVPDVVARVPCVAAR